MVYHIIINIITIIDELTTYYHILSLSLLFKPWVIGLTLSKREMKWKWKPWVIW